MGGSKRESKNSRPHINILKVVPFSRSHLRVFPLLRLCFSSCFLHFYHLQLLFVCFGLDIYCLPLSKARKLLRAQFFFLLFCVRQLFRVFFMCHVYVLITAGEGNGADRQGQGQGHYLHSIIIYGLLGRQICLPFAWHLQLVALHCNHFPFPLLAALKVKLMVRRPHSQLVEQGIIPCK